MAALSLSLLGPFQASLGRDPLDDFRTRKVQALLVYLAAEPRAHSRDSLLDLLWPRMPEKSARVNLRQILYLLRQAIPEVSDEGDQERPLVITNRHEIQLNARAAVAVDTWGFESLLEKAHSHDHLDLFLCAECAGDLQEAAGLYRGDFLEDFYLDDSNEFEVWAQTRREYFRRKALDVLAILTRMAIRDRDYAAAETEARRQLQIDIVREGAYRQLMQALALSGRREQAIAAYERCRRVLAEELGMAPTARTTEIYEKVVGGDLRFDRVPQPGVRGYELKEQIGEGAYGAVYRAVQPAILRQVAVKVIRRKYADDADFIRRFEAEAQTVARLEHPYIVPLYDYWRDPEGAYLVMRYMSGGSLLGALEGGPWEGERAAAMVEQIAGALAIAHRQGVVHRDIKPANILLDEEGNAYLADFGIAKDFGSQRQRTAAGRALGILDYVSPEQITGDEVLPQADIYSLGAVLYETLTGEKPFGRASVANLLHSHLHEPMPLVTATRPDVPPDVDAVLQKATAKEPADRYATVLEMAAAFRGAVDGVEAGAVGRARESLPALAEIYNPYKGLHAFQESDADDFFGREALVQQLLNRLGAGAAGQDGRFPDSDGTRFMALVGPSGSGKSSAVKAGLIPALREGALPGSDEWFITEMVPGMNPLAELELALWRVAVDPPPDLVEPMQRDIGGILRTVRRVLPPEPAPGRGGPQLLLLIDQFEELFTLVKDDDRRAFFLDSLLQAMEAPRSPLRVVATLRADFYDRPLQHPKWGQLLKQHSEIVLPLNSTELTWAIREPAARVGVRLEQGLAATIVADVADQPGALPLLQYTMTELFDRRSNGRLTKDAYEAIGQVQGALGRRAEALYGELDERGREAARQLFLRLVTLGEGVEDTRRRVLRSELETLAAPEEATGKAEAPLETVLDRFGAARFLTFDRNPHTREPTVEVAHEALLREWPRLRTWLAESRDDVRLQRRLADASAEWAQAGQDEGYLLRGSRLDLFADWAAELDLALTQTEEAFLAISVTARQQRQAAEKERQRRELQTARQLAQEQSRRAQEQAKSATILRRRAIYLGTALVVAAILAVLALIANRQSSINAEAAQTQSAILLASSAEAQLEAGYYDRAVLLALEALQNYPYTSQAERALGRAASYNRAISQYSGHDLAVTGVDWSPDGRRIASTSSDNTVHITDAATGETERIIRLPEGISGNQLDMGLAVQWSPDGRTLAVLTGDRYLLGSQDFDLTLWEAATGRQIAIVEIDNEASPEQGDTGVPTSFTRYPTGQALDFAEKSRQLASVGGDSSALIWSTDLTKPVLRLRGHENDVNTVHWSPDEQRLATSSLDGTVRIWDAQSGEELQRLEGHDGQTTTARWSPDGTLLATADENGQICIWAASESESAQCYATNAGPVWSLVWSADGQRLISGHEDTIIRIWEAASGNLLETMQGHNGPITSLSSLPGKDEVVSGGGNNSVRVWNSASSTALVTLPTTTSLDPDWSNDGRYLALPTGDVFTGSAPPALAIWDMEEMRMAEENLTQEYGLHVAGPRYSPDDSRLLIRGLKDIWPNVLPEGLVLRAIDATDGALLATFRSDDDENWFRDIAWSPDGSQVAGGKINGEVHIWDYATGELITTLQHSKDGQRVFIIGVNWSPDGSQFATSGQQGSVRIWDAKSWELLFPLVGHDSSAHVPRVAWSPDGSRILTVAGNDETGSVDTTARIWDASSGEALRTINGHKRMVRWGTWSPDGSRLVTASLDDTTRVWDAATGDELLKLNTPNIFLTHADWSPDGKHLAVSGYGQQAEIWRVWQSTGELIEYAYDCCVFRELTADEREQFGLPLVDDARPSGAP